MASYPGRFGQGRAAFKRHAARLILAENKGQGYTASMPATRKPPPDDDPDPEFSELFDPNPPYDPAGEEADIPDVDMPEELEIR